MMKHIREKSREEWEQELISRQRNITPVEYPEGLHYATIPGSPKIFSLGKFLLGTALIAIGVALFSYTAPALTAIAATAIAALAIAPGLYLVITAIRWKDEHKRTAPPTTLKP
jgi:hypothetical protein